jgi:hypothetical protein
VSAPNGYPVDAHGFVRQCAWCRRVADEGGRNRLVSATLLPGASHGCCDACAIRFLGRGSHGRHGLDAPRAGR